MKYCLPFCFLLLLTCTNSTSDAPILNKEVSIRLAAEPDRLHPLLSTTSFAGQVENQIFLPLLQFDPQTLDLMPVLATGRPLITDLGNGRLAYRFDIRPESRWDDGRPVEASDYLFSLKCLFNPAVAASPYRAAFNFVEDARVHPEDARQLEVITNRTYILAEAALGNLSIYPQRQYDPQDLMAEISLRELITSDAETLLAKYPQLETFAVQFSSATRSHDPEAISGCGPYALQEWQPGERLVLEKKANWWGDALGDSVELLRAKPSRLIYRPIGDANAAISLLKSGELDVMGSIPPVVFQALLKESTFQQDFQLYTPPFLAYYFIAMNHRDALLADQRVRRALAHLTDTEQIIEQVMGGWAEPINGPIHPSKPYYHAGLSPVNFDLTRARVLLEEAGWHDTDGDGWRDRMIEGERRPLRLTYNYSNRNGTSEIIGRMFQESARKAGVEIELQEMALSRLVQDSKQRNYQLYQLAWSQPPTLDDLRQIWHTSSDTPSGSNRVGFGNAVTDAIIDSIRVTLDDSLRTALYHRIQEAIYEAQPYIFLYAPRERIAIHRRIRAEVSARRPGYFEQLFEFVLPQQE